MNDCSSIQGSTASSSSDVMTLTTASSWCAIPTSSRIRVLRLVRPHTRRILMVPDTNPSFGFTVRGGKEFGTGFFVSSVERSSEAEMKGLRIGDQILRINGFRVDDAVHKEFIQFVSSQDRVTLKVRGVGMLPTKDRESDRISWHVVKTPAISGSSSTPSESSYQASLDPTTTASDTRSKDISVVLNVAPRTKLGLGICKGPEWKPGIFVQFTKEKSVAREAGLRPGDQILSVNSIDFADVLFSEAVAVMKGSNKLEMMVRTAAGCDLFPGESSGYNSSASSVTGDQSPCWADPKSKRLTAVREEPSATGSGAAMTGAGWSESLYARKGEIGGSSGGASSAVATAAVIGKEANKTIIKLSENGTSINNTYVTNPPRGRLGGEKEKTIGKIVGVIGAPPPPPPGDKEYVNFNHVSRTNENRTAVVVEVHRNGQLVDGGNARSQLETRQSKQQPLLEDHKDYEYATFKSHPSSWGKPNTNNKLNHTMPKPPPPISSSHSDTCQRRQQDSPNRNNDNNDSNSNSTHHSVGGNVNGSTLSSAITEELKKRKEKQRQQQQQQQRHLNNNENIYSNNTPASSLTSVSTPSSSALFTSNQQHQQQLRQPSQLSKRTPSVRVATGSSNSNNNNNNDHNTLNGDQHSALMDEFKRAHQRMFKKGFQESERQTQPQPQPQPQSPPQPHQERQDALKHTAMMEDDVNYRAIRKTPAVASSAKAATTATANGTATATVTSTNRHGHGQQGNSEIDGVRETPIQHVPPPPPEFANSSPTFSTPPPPPSTAMKMKSPGSGSNAYKQFQKQLNSYAIRAPNTPAPDYDNNPQTPATTAPATSVISRSNKLNGFTGNGSIATAINNNSNSNTNGHHQQHQQQRITMRLGSVTIGEYDAMNGARRKEPGKFDFSNGSTTSSTAQDNANRADHHHEDISLRTELQNTLKRVNMQKQQQQQQHQLIEHQSHCPMQNGSNGSYASVKFGGVKQINGSGGVRSSSAVVNSRSNLATGSGSVNSGGTGTGILKNGNSRTHSNGYPKNTEKSIKFGN